MSWRSSAWGPRPRRRPNRSELGVPPEDQRELERHGRSGTARHHAGRVIGCGAACGNAHAVHGHPGSATANRDGSAAAGQADCRLRPPRTARHARGPDRGHRGRPPPGSRNCPRAWPRSWRRTSGGTSGWPVAAATPGSRRRAAPGSRRARNRRRPPADSARRGIHGPCGSPKTAGSGGPCFPECGPPSDGGCPRTSRV